MANRRPIPGWLMAAIVLGGTAGGRAAAPPDRLSFNRDVRPILSDTCFLCHGFDGHKREAGPRLDLREAALAETQGGVVPIVPGDPDSSGIIARIFDAHDPMPPESAHKPLTDAQKEILRRWVAEGAEYEPHWAYAPLVRPPLPPGPEGRHPIDAFIDAGLAARRLEPGPAAPPHMLARRLALDLTGLPPHAALPGGARPPSDPDAAVGAAWFGSTFGCAECHDYKFDPILSRDFYELRAFFAALKQWGVPSDYGYTPEPALKGINNGSPFPPEIEVESPWLVQELAATRRRLDEALGRWDREIGGFLAAHPDGWTVPRADPADSPPAAPSPRPDAGSPADASPPTASTQPVPAAPPAGTKPPAPPKQARLVALRATYTLDDLGSQGEPPSHPELLDWLACEFRESGWDVKRMIRLIVTSAAYRRSSLLSPRAIAVDPANRLLATQNPRRLEAEFIRDNALAIAGLLDLDAIGGPSVKPYQPDGHYDALLFPNRTYVADDETRQWRRGVYVHWQRTFLHPMLAAFDAPARDECAVARIASNTPQLQNAVLKARGPFATFRKHVAAGIEISDLFPHLAKQADRLCVIRSLQTEQINHDTAHAFMNTGSIIKGRPSMGSWLLYGLGSATDNLPGFVVLTSAGQYGQQPISARQWSSGVLPSRFQGILFQPRGDAVHYIGSPPGVCQSTQRQVIEEVARLNGLLAEEQVDPEIATRIAPYEIAFRMQASVPELPDFTGETRETLDLYGVRELGDGSFASNCLLARRLAERGVRMIQLHHRGWDHHSDIVPGMTAAAADVDRPTAALLEDLARRGLLDDTLVLFGGEFGRTPMGQGTGRDHHILSFSEFLAGGGVRAGTTWGATDELGYRAVENVVHVHDLHATMLALLGIDHHRLTTKFQGLDVRLTGIAGRVVSGVMA